jgi:hypothetical protein
MTDHTFFIPAARLLKARPRTRQSLAIVDWASPMMDGALGARHALELAMFGTCASRRGAVLRFKY